MEGIEELKLCAYFYAGLAPAPLAACCACPAASCGSSSQASLTRRMATSNLPVVVEPFDPKACR